MIYENQTFRTPIIPKAHETLFQTFDTLLIFPPSFFTISQKISIHMTLVSIANENMERRNKLEE